MTHNGIIDAHRALASWQSECSDERPDLSHETSLRRDEEGTWWCSVTSRHFDRGDDDVYRNGIDCHSCPLEAVRRAIGRWAAQRYVTLSQAAQQMRALADIVEARQPEVQKMVEGEPEVAGD